MDEQMNKQMDKYIPMSPSNSISGGQKKFYEICITVEKSLVKPKTMSGHYPECVVTYTGLILGLHPANERRRCKVTPSLIGWAQTWNDSDSRLAPSQWEMALQSNTISHWLGANLESALL